MIKKIIEAGYKPYIVLTHNEETGGAGVKSFLEDYPTKINNLKLAIGIDRGFHSKIKQFDPIKDKLNQVVFYNNDSQDLKNFFFNHGFSQAIGTNSDIKKIGDSYQVPYANISAAYINEHRSYERTYIDDLECILNNLKNIMEENNNLNLTFKKI
jgi:putative aminopeptidase FrvX